ncbi:hypothetical protein CCACVL1_20346, partial [Corchorus capsularis]
GGPLKLLRMDPMCQKRHPLPKTDCEA